MKDEDKVIDWRSTGRRKARKELYVNYVPYECDTCKRSVKFPPKDAPLWFEEIWPEERRVLDSQLQAQHMTKDLTQNSVQFLKWLCPSCHKLEDSKTEKGVSVIDQVNLLPDIDYE